MSLLGQRTAIISLGVSCQTARQLIRNAGLLSGLIQDELRHRRMPFDWVISGPEAMAEWIRDDLPFPRSPYDLMSVARGSDGYEWRGRRLLFWHDFRGGWRGGLSLFSMFDRNRQKYQHLRKTFQLAGSLERVVLVVSNMQNNLATLAGPFADDFRFTERRLAVLKEAVERQLRRNCEMLVVSNNEECAGTAVIERDASVWEGNDAGWAAALQAYFAP